jgi:RecJ-like exonuclease
MSDELNNTEEPDNKLKLAKTNSLERELNSSLTKAVHQKYGSEADIDEIAKQRRQNMRVRFYCIITAFLIFVVMMFIWIKKGNFLGENPVAYKDLVTAISNFTVKSKDGDNLPKLASALAKFSAESRGTDDNCLATGYAVFSIQEIKAGYVELGVTDCKKTIERYPEAPCVEHLKKIVAGLTCEKCKGTGVVLQKCDMCNGSGRCPKCKGKKQVQTLSGQSITCNRCSGTGKCPQCFGRKKIKKECQTCQGTGSVFDERIFNKEAAKIMTKALTGAAYKHTKAEVIDSLNKMQKRMNKKKEKSNNKLVN